MGIKDHNGTTNTEIGKVYDYDGTTNHQIGKVYDNNGTTNSLIYSAEFVYFPNEYTSVQDNWTMGGVDAGWGVGSSSLWIYGASDGTTIYPTGYYVNFSSYKKLCFTVASNNSTSGKFTLDVRAKNGNTRYVNYYISTSSSPVGDHTIDISSINEECYILIVAQNGRGGTITKIWLEE